MFRFAFSLLAFVFCSETIFAQSFSTQHLTYAPSGSQEIMRVDVDGDGYYDVVHRSKGSADFRWIRNNGNGQFGLSLPIQSSVAGGFFQAGFVDMDQDDKPDLVSFHEPLPSPFFFDSLYREVVWQKNLGSGNFGPSQLIYRYPDTVPHVSVRFRPDWLKIKDLNRDGKPDFVFSAMDITPGCIAVNFVCRVMSDASTSCTFMFGSTFSGSYYFDCMPFQTNAAGDWAYLLHYGFSSMDGFYVEEPNTTSPFYGDFQLDNKQFLGTQSNQTVLTDVGDLRGDSLSEVLGCYKMTAATDAYKLGYFTLPLGVQGNFHLIETGNGKYSSIHITDLNADGLKDIVASRSDKLVWYRNMGNGEFAPDVLAEDFSRFSALTSGDMDQDGDTDLLAFDMIQQRIILLENGGTYLPNVCGKIFYDANVNCINDQTATWRSPVFLKIMPGEILTSSSNSGVFSKNLAPGQYSVQLLNPPDGLMVDSVCGNPSLDFVLDSLDNTSVVDIGLIGTSCALLSVSVTGGNRIPCRKTVTNIQIANEGLGAATSATLRVKLPPVATYRSFSSNFYTNYMFDNATQEHVFSAFYIPGSDTRILTIIDSNACNLQNVNKTFCTEAIISYVGKCPLTAPGWDQSDLIVSGKCLPDGAAAFEIRNRGLGDMADSSLYELISSEGITNTGHIKLEAGQSTWLSTPGANQFLMLRVQQRPHHPTGASASAITGLCQANGFDSDSMLSGSVGRKSNVEQAIFCTIMRNSYDPNDKKVFPTGWGAIGNVASGSELRYMIRFENTGTAPANYVRISDTLSPYLDPASVRHIASSHQSQMVFSMEGTSARPVLHFTFPDIVLPDSNTSKEKSQGYVMFSISAKAGLPQQTSIRNQAAITFDINDPIKTNQTVNTINDSIPVATPLVLAVRQKLPPLNFSIFPNPSTGIFQLNFPGPQSGELMVYDSHGKCVMRQGVSFQSTIGVNCSAQSAGIYLIHFRTNDQRVLQAKVILE